MQSRSRINPLLLVALAQGIAFWPVWVWYAKRLMDPSSERWGVAALAVALVLIVVEPVTEERGMKVILLLWPLLVLYIVTYIWLPMIFPSALALFSLAFTLHAHRRMNVATWGLLVLSLPLLPSLDFYGGYPLRVVTGYSAAALLRLAGHAVIVEGVLLRYGEALVMIDAPCSGLRMLWGGIFVAFSLSGIFRCAPVVTLQMVTLAGVLVLLANMFRAALLFFVETGRIALPGWGHEAVGLVLFMEIAMVLFWCCNRLRRRNTPCTA